jgi:hypothetical protein
VKKIYDKGHSRPHLCPMLPRPGFDRTTIEQNSAPTIFPTLLHRIVGKIVGSIGPELKASGEVTRLQPS